MLATDVQIPPETPAEPEPHDRTRPIVALVVALLVIAGGVGWWLASGDDDGDLVATSPPAEPVSVTESYYIPYATDSWRFAVGSGEIVSAESDTVMSRFVPDGEGPWPVAVLIHGRAMVGTDMTWPAKAIAERGVIVYAPTYPGGKYWGTSAEQVESELWAGTTVLGDLSCAVRAARADALDHGGDPDRLIVVGHSAGGTFGATLALIDDDPELTAGSSGSCVVAEGSSSPAAFVGWEGGYDWDALSERSFSAALEPEPEAIRALGPLATLDQRTPDRTVPFHLRSGDREFEGIDFAAHMVRFEEALTEAGLPVSAEVLPGETHAEFVGIWSIPEVVDLVVEVAYDPRG